MRVFDRVLRPAVMIIRGAPSNVFVRVRWDGARLSFRGVEGPTLDGNCRGSCGQISRRDDYQAADGWTTERVARLWELWERWHLNDMRAGCEHQRAEGWTVARVSEPCPTCGYKYGTAWIREDVPAAVLEELAAMPKTTVTPAWV